MLTMYVWHRRREPERLVEFRLPLREHHQAVLQLELHYAHNHFWATMGRQSNSDNYHN